MQAFAIVAIGEDCRRLEKFDDAISYLADGLRRASALGLEPLLNEGLIALGQLLNTRGAEGHARRVAGLLAARALGDVSEKYAVLCRALGEPAPTPLSMQSMGEILEDVIDEAEIGALGAPIGVVAERHH